MFQEYPKCLNHKGSSTVVFDAAQEELARADGFVFHGEIEAHEEIEAPDMPVRNKPGRKPKVE